MATIVDRVFVYDDRVTAIALNTDFGIVLDVPESAPNEVLTAVTESTEKAQEAFQSSVPHSGSDGIRTRDLGLDRAAC